MREECRAVAIASYTEFANFNFFFGFFKTAMSFPWRKQSVIQLYSDTGSISDSEEHRCEEEYVLYIRSTCVLCSSRIKSYRRHSQWWPVISFSRQQTSLSFYFSFRIRVNVERYFKIAVHDLMSFRETSHTLINIPHMITTP